MAKVGIVMGSDSDMPIMAKAADILEELGIDYEMTIISAHREPDVFFEYAKERRGKRLQGDHRRCGNGSPSSGYVRGNLPDAGHRYPDAYHISWRKRFPVLHRTDALRYSGGNRGHQRRQQMRVFLRQRSWPPRTQALLGRLKAYSEKMKAQVEAKDARLKEIGYKELHERLIK